MMIYLLTWYTHRVHLGSRGILEMTKPVCLGGGDTSAGWVATDQVSGRTGGELTPWDSGEAQTQEAPVTVHKAQSEEGRLESFLSLLLGACLSFEFCMFVVGRRCTGSACYSE